MADLEGWTPAARWTCTAI